jgi:hypothetical protein
LDEAVANFMAARTFHTGALAVMKDSKLVYRQGFGWRDSQFSRLAHPNNLFRLASVTKPQDQNPWEVWYDDLGIGQTAVDFPQQSVVRDVDGGGLYWESFDSFVSLCASATDLCRFLRCYWLAGPKRQDNIFWSWGYLFYGSMPGASISISQNIAQTPTSTNGLEYVALFNKRTGGNDDPRPYILNAVSNITSWPTNGGGMIQWNVPSTNINKSAGNVTVMLVRTGSNTLPVKASYTTYSDTSSADSFSPDRRVISFAAGESVKPVSIQLLTGGIDLTNRFFLELISASGGAWLGDQTSCVVNIRDTNSMPRFVGVPNVRLDGTFSAQVAGGVGLPMNLQFSTNLSSWKNLKSFTNGSGLVGITDTNASLYPNGFYRISVP